MFFYAKIFIFVWKFKFFGLRIEFIFTISESEIRKKWKKVTKYLSIR